MPPSALGVRSKNLPNQIYRFAKAPADAPMRLNLAIEQVLVKLAYPGSSRLRLHQKHRLPADTPVAQLVGNSRNVAPVPLRPDLRRQ